MTVQRPPDEEVKMIPSHDILGIASDADELYRCHQHLFLVFYIPFSVVFIFHFSMPRVSDEKFTPIIYSCRWSLWNGSA